MLRRLVPIGLVALAACAPPPEIGTPPPAVRLPETLRIQVRDDGADVVRRVPLERYVLATILSEFAPAAGDPAAVARMYELQAILSRTYAVAHQGRHARDGFDLCSTTHCQLYQPARLGASRWADTAGRATARTAGRVLWFGTAPAVTLFHADCGGHTSDAASVWGGTPLPYLAGVTDDGAREAHGTWTFEAGREAIRRALNARATTAVGARLVAIEPVERDPAGRLSRVRLRGESDRVVRGEDFRAAMTSAFGARSVKSTRFEVRRRRDTFHFDGQGFGHGVGLCQAGAYARLRAGATVDNALRHYFPGTRLR